MLEVKKIKKFRNNCFGFYKTKTFFESAEKTNFHTKLSMHRLFLGLIFDNHNISILLFSLLIVKVKVKVKEAQFFLQVKVIPSRAVV